MKSVDASIYTKKYFLSDCEGYDYWERSQGRELNSRLAYAWGLAGVKRGERVLDYGCGRGEMVVQTALAGARVVGVDYAQEAVSLSRRAIYENKLRRRAQAIWVRGRRLPFGDGEFDTVFFLDVAEHLYPEELDQVMGELRRVVKKGGRLIVHTAPNKHWLDGGYQWYTRWANWVASKLVWERLFHTKLQYEKNPRSTYDLKVHVNEQTLESLTGSAKAAGWEEVRVWLDSGFRIVSKGYWFQFVFLQPIWLPVLGKFFQMDIWAELKK